MWTKGGKEERSFMDIETFKTRSLAEAQGTPGVLGMQAVLEGRQEGAEYLLESWALS